ncbi:hypothetical protein D3C78_1327520 [compost metagenome]
MFDQAMDLAHAGTRGDQHERTVRQLLQVGITKRQFDPHHVVALQLFNQIQRTGFARQYVDFQVAPRMRGRGEREGGFFAVLALDHQVLPGVVARRFAGRSPQTHAPGVAAHLLALNDLTRHAAHRQFSQREHAIPQHDAVFQRLRYASVELAMVTHIASLLDPAFHQQRRAHVAIAVAAALRAFVAQTSCAIENPLAGQYLKHCSGGLQGYTHQSIPN